jgi:hypothetical protein
MLHVLVVPGGSSGRPVRAEHYYLEADSCPSSDPLSVVTLPTNNKADAPMSVPDRHASLPQSQIL